MLQARLIRKIIRHNYSHQALNRITCCFCNKHQKPQDDEPKEKQQSSPKITIKPFDYSKFLRDAAVDRAKVRAYLRRMGNSSVSNHLWTMNWLYQSVRGRQPDLLNELKIKDLRDLFSSPFPMFNKQRKWQFLIWVVLSLLIMYYLKALASDKQGDLLKQTMTDFEELEQPMLHLLANLHKIYITPKEEEMLDLNSIERQENSQSKIKDKTRRVKISYRIEMEDTEGRNFRLSRYEGDPNHLLRMIEKLQEERPNDEKAQVFFKKYEEFSLYNAFWDTLGLVTPFLMIALPIYIFRKSSPDTLIQSLGQGKKDFKIQSVKNIKVKFDDVAGMEQAKREVTEFVDFLKYSQRYKTIGAKIPKGALLTGPPGTGKTMLAKACAGEANVSFFYISGSEFVEIFVGLGASKVRSLFEKARQESPSIIFIDEIDAIGKKREHSRNEEKDTTLNQLLVEMDGFASGETVIVLAATNRKQTLDNALIRPGRFDRMVEVNLPDVKQRQQIFMVHLKPLKISPEIERKDVAKRMAELSPGFSGADIANLCNEAAIIASRKNNKFIVQTDFEEAAERITAGYVKKNLMNKKTRRRVAYHEAGHAVAGWFLRGGNPLVKLTIIPRSKGALGYAQYLPKNVFIQTKDELVDQVAIMLGGITSQQMFFGNMSSGGSDDLQKVYDLTHKMITQFGMGSSTYNVTLEEETYVQKQSTYLTDIMDDEVQSLLQSAKKRARHILEQKRTIIDSLADSLLEKETLNSAQIVAIMGERPVFEPDQQPAVAGAQENTKSSQFA